MINKNFFILIFSAIAGSEILSFLAHLFPLLKVPFFILLCLIFLIFTYKDLKNGMYFILAELIIGSKGGYLFYLNLDEYTLSIRMAFWFLFLALWFFNYLVPTLIKKEKINLFSLRYGWFKYYIILIVFVLWGFINGLVSGNGFNNVFLDFNAYLYFLILFPLLNVLNNSSNENKKDLASKLIYVFGSATLWISVKTLIILFLFSHKLERINSILYTWIRSSGVGEITQMDGGFYRVFFQSHIFAIILLISLIIILVSRICKSDQKIMDFYKNNLNKFLLFSLIIVVATVIISMSRSNWVGLTVSSFFGLIFIIRKFKLKGFITAIALSGIIFLISYSLVIVLVKFPYPKPIGGFAAGDIFAERASELTNEAGVSSRWNLLPELYEKIKEAPIEGSGFGETVTYVSNDPRVRSLNKDGVYTTFAFEWGWLDIWIKIGLLGFLSYVFFLISILLRGYKLILMHSLYEEIYISIALAIFCLSAINSFSPYMNHPLGIGLLIFGIVLMESLLIYDKNT